MAMSISKHKESRYSFLNKNFVFGAASKEQLADASVLISLMLMFFKP